MYFDTKIKLHVITANSEYEYLLHFYLPISLAILPGGLMTYLRYLCWFAYSGVPLILCCVLVFVFIVLCTLCMLPVSLYCPFSIAFSVFSNVYSKVISFYSKICFTVPFVRVRINLFSYFFSILCNILNSRIKFIAKS